MASLVRLAEVASVLPLWSSCNSRRIYWVSGRCSSSVATTSRILIPGKRISLYERNRGDNMRLRAGDDDAFDDFDDALSDRIESSLDLLDEAPAPEEIITAEEPEIEFGLPQLPLSLAPVDARDRFLKPESQPGMVVNYKINEDEFHKISLQQCDFFIRKVPDADNDLYDFREMYVTPPDTDVYSIPRIIGKMPKERTRCSKGLWFDVVWVDNKEGKNNPREGMGRNVFETMKVFLIKHYKNRRRLAERFILNLDRVWVIDGATKSIRRAKVKMEAPAGEDRDRTKEILVVRDQGKTLTIIPEEKRKRADEIIEEMVWDRSRMELEEYIRTFRDFDVSNWF